MPLMKTTQISRPYNPYDRQYRCLNCGKEIFEVKGIYSRRFCSQDCYYEYLL